MRWKDSEIKLQDEDEDGVGNSMLHLASIGAV